MKEYWYGYVSDFLTPKEPDIRYMDVREEPFEIHGIFEPSKDNFYRLPLAFAKTVSIPFDCTADWCHPNDMGMYYMALGIGKALSQI